MSFKNGIQMFTDQNIHAHFAEVSLKSSLPRPQGMIVSKGILRPVFNNWPLSLSRIRAQFFALHVK